MAGRSMLREAGPSMNPSRYYLRLSLLVAFSLVIWALIYFVARALVELA